ncbi:MAG: DUF4178 domain-containing protein [Candidatus Xenobia bacterium]
MLTLNCPSCHSSVPFANPASFCARCSSCGAALLRQEMELTAHGLAGILHEDGTLLKVGTTGRWQNRTFTVVGRLQVQYGSGFWNEWFLHFSDGHGGWLAEATGTYFINFQKEVANPPVRHVGDTVDLDGRPYVVVQEMRGQIVAFEGELPYRAESGQPAASLDLRGWHSTGATIDVSEEPPLVFEGEFADFDAFHFDNLRQEVPVPGAVECAGCKASLILRNPGNSQMRVCEHCGTAMDLTRPGSRQAWKGETRGGGEIPLGARGTLRGEEWECLAWMRRHVVVDDQNYPWTEYLLYNRRHGYRWLIQTDKHWVFAEPAMGMPAAAGTRQLVGEVPRADLAYDGRTFRHFQSAKAILDAMAGELYWKVQPGDHAKTHDFIAPPMLLSAEVAGDEITWTIGTYMMPKEIEAAFKIGGLGSPLGIAPAQPNPYGRPMWTEFAILSLVAMLITIAFNLLAARQIVHHDEWDFYPLEPEHAHVTEPFTIGGHTSNVVTRIQTTLNNRWAYFHFALINEQTHEAFDFGQDVSFYAGVDDGEGWSEGDHNAEVTVPDVPPGTYTLLVDPMSGTGDQPDPTAKSLPATGPGPALFHYDLTLVRDEPAVSWFFAVLALLVIPPIVQQIGYGGFEKQRWMESDHAG